MLSHDGKKLACEKCIKGHRSSVCKHSDRPLLEIKPKGRPQTQCDHCRELRQRKQVHVKCSCASKADSKSSTSSTNGSPPSQHRSQSSQSTSPDPSHGGSGSRCACGDGPECHCCIPRKSSVKRKPTSQPSTTAGSPKDIPSHVAPSSPVMTRLSELRDNQLDNAGPIHLPSHAASHVSAHSHSSSFSPYQRAYSLHGPQRTLSNPGLDQVDLGQEIFTQGAGGFDFLDEPFAPLEAQFAPNFPLPCSCGPNCACLGCREHHPLTAGAQTDPFAVCSNPTNCLACLDSTILSMPEVPLPTLSDLDEFWLNQLAQGVNHD